MEDVRQRNSTIRTSTEGRQHACGLGRISPKEIPKRCQKDKINDRRRLQWSPEAAQSGTKL